jgi:wyosine [tRNA(Phe)-imidazoG37] synthetase (radical SAM superfamily)
MAEVFKYIYGPVHSWRLGISLGIDPLSQKAKICNYNCVYCQLGPTSQLTTERGIFVRTKEIVAEITKFQTMPIDYLTFSGRGEPTLAANLGEMIRALRKVRHEKIAVITNSSIIHRPDVQDDLAEADFVLAKLDAGTAETFGRVDAPSKGVDFHNMVEAIISFRRIFKGKLALQMMFVAENIGDAPAMAEIARRIGPDEVEINTPTRLCASQALNETEISCIKSHFDGLPAVSLYERARTTIEPVHSREAQRRHGRYLSSP